MATDMEQFYQLFFDETEELLHNLEKLLLGVDVQTPDAETLHAIFRIVHSIKGGAATFGFADLTDMSHVMESMLDQLRHGQTLLTRVHQDVFLQAKDVLKMQLDALRLGSAVDAERAANVRMILDSMADPHHLQPAPRVLNALVKSAAEPQGAGPVRCFDIGLPATTAAADVAALQQELALLGELRVVSDCSAQFQLLSSASPDDILALCSFVLDPQDVQLKEQTLQLAAIAETPATFTTATTATTAEAPVAAAAAAAGASSPSPAARTAVAGGSESSTIRVNIEKVDQLINLVGELVITHAMLMQRAQSLLPVVHEPLLSGMGQLGRNTRDLQESVMSMRMMPMDFVFSRFPRMVHQLSSQLGKSVHLVTEGDSTELDKGLIEKIIDPLTHLVRNSIDHGLETPAQRLGSGKPEVGQLRLIASHQGSHIVLEVQDDGAGMNREKILAKARAQGQVIADSATDDEVWPLIFQPGFSTAEQVTDVSGRGVGMDVVQRNISSLGGSIRISSQRGQGSRIRISLPLTLAILEGMSVRVAGETYVLALSNVLESFQPRRQDIKTLNQLGCVVQVRGAYLPLISLAEVFQTQAHSLHPCEGIVVLVATEQHTAAVWVDALVGQQQVVVKNIETHYRKVPYVSGATVLGDGSVALIVDIAAVLSEAERATAKA